MALIDTDATRDFSGPLVHALGKYWDDTDQDHPNLASKAFWPSTGAYGSIFHRMGLALGEEAAASLTGVPDEEIRLLSQIALATALCRLSELQSTSIKQRHRPDWALVNHP